MIKTPIAENETKQEQFTQLYLNVFPLVAKYISNAGGNLDETRDVFQEALLVYYEKMVLLNFEPHTNPKAYILGISKNIWLKKKGQEINTEPIENLELSENQNIEPASEKILLYLQQSGKKCMDMLQSFYYEKMSMANLSNHFGFRNERSATVQKYKCLEKVRDVIRKKSLNYEDFLN
ncbi:sigma-70 family RNA polymerase sigma factor [Reichenbachiella sp. MALMAid0571]|uniref:RNA polymerase sigma factor n=1 Tax=Reichenbachiella sp. MALMAid0571 TaxID=3143939 RepID=UPI0032DFBA63